MDEEIENMEVWVATGNSGKLREFRFLLRELSVDLHGQNELDFFSPPPENGDSFLANAQIKARALAAVKPGVWVIADDSGLCCEGLGGLPGIHSARYAGDKAKDTDNQAKLLKMLQMRTTNRKAHFHCSLVAISPAGEEIQVEGQLLGQIARKQSGQGGFGYDPVFIPEGYEKTLAELEPQEKNKISHRAQAMARLLPRLQPST